MGSTRSEQLAQLVGAHAREQPHVGIDHEAMLGALEQWPVGETVGVRVLPAGGVARVAQGAALLGGVAVAVAHVAASQLTQTRTTPPELRAYKGAPEPSVVAALV
jgi:hypothetical protein